MVNDKHLTGSIPPKWGSEKLLLSLPKAIITESILDLPKQCVSLKLVPQTTDFSQSFRVLAAVEVWNMHRPQAQLLWPPSWVSLESFGVLSLRLGCLLNVPGRNKVGGQVNTLATPHFTASTWAGHWAGFYWALSERGKHTESKKDSQKKAAL